MCPGKDRFTPYLSSEGERQRIGIHGSTPVRQIHGCSRESRVYRPLRRTDTCVRRAKRVTSGRQIHTPFFLLWRIVVLRVNRKSERCADRKRHKHWNKLSCAVSDRASQRFHV